MVRLQVPAYSQAPELFPTPEAAYDELLRLASLARALKPSLPAHVRLFCRGGVDSLERFQEPGRLVFTTDTRPDLTEGLQDPNAVDLFDVLEVPPRVVAALRKRLDLALGQESGFTVSRAFAAASREGRVSLSTVPTNDPEVAIVSSPALELPALGFASDPFLEEMAVAHLSRSRMEGADPAFDRISAIRQVRQLLSQDVSELPARQINTVLQLMRTLESSEGEESYESRSRQGWLAYSLLAGGRGWAHPLLVSAPGMVDPHAPFRGVSPIVAAVLANDSVATRVLLEHGVSPNVYLPGIPPALPAEDHRAVTDRLGDRFPLASLAAAVGSSSALAALAQAGAILDAPGSEGKTALHQAVAIQDEAVVRVLLYHGANPHQPDAYGQSPIDLASGAVKDVLDPTPAARRPRP